MYPGFALLFSGVMLMAILMTGPMEIGSVNLDIHTMLFSGLFMIVGMQAICFALFSRQISDYHLKLASSPPTHFQLEYGLIAALILLVIGLSGSSYTLFYWMEHSFGPLVPTQIMRILIPSITTIILGMQLMFASFFMSLLRIHLIPAV
jgi:hypothetical protein